MHRTDFLSRYCFWSVCNSHKTAAAACGTVLAAMLSLELQLLTCVTATAATNEIVVAPTRTLQVLSVRH
jgi:hypothetical protein